MILAGPIFACMLQAARAYENPVELLVAVQEQEGGWPGLERANRDGSRDYGIMQINSQWVPRLAAHWNKTPQETVAILRFDNCANVYASSWLLRAGIEEKRDFWRGVGSYNSPRTALALKYEFSIWRILVKDFGPRPFGVLTAEDILP